MRSVELYRLDKTERGSERDRLFGEVPAKVSSIGQSTHGYSSPEKKMTWQSSLLRQLSWLMAYLAKRALPLKQFQFLLVVSSFSFYKAKQSAWSPKARIGLNMENVRKRVGFACNYFLFYSFESLSCRVRIGRGDFHFCSSENFQNPPHSRGTGRKKEYSSKVSYNILISKP